MTQATLKVWGRYRRNGWNPNLGYPKRNTIHRVMKEGHGASQSTGDIEEDVPADVMVVDRAMGVLSSLHRGILEAIYVDRLSVRKASRKYEKNPTSFHSELRQAERKVDGFLECHHLMLAS